MYSMWCKTESHTSSESPNENNCCYWAIPKGCSWHSWAPHHKSWQQICACCSRLFLQVCQPLCHSRPALHNTFKMSVQKLHLWLWNSRNAAHRSRTSIWVWPGETFVWIDGHPKNMHQPISSSVWWHDLEIQQNTYRSVSQVTSSTARWMGWLPQPSCFGLQHQPTFYNRFHPILPHTWPWSQDACKPAVA